MRLALLAACAAAASAKIAPVWSDQYLLSGWMTMPYANVTETFTTYMDAVNDRQRIDWYGGLDVYIYRGDLNVTQQLNAVVNAFACFQTNGSVSLVNFLPDMSGYSYNGVTTLPARGGMQVDDWVLSVTNAPSKTRVSTYHLYSDATTGYPVQLDFLGYDTVIGSHYDIYNFTFSAYVPASNGVAPFPATVFNQPADECGAFPGPGVSDPAEEGQGLIRELIPQGSSAPAPALPKEDPAFAAFVQDFKGGAWYASSEEEAQRHSIFTGNRRMITVANRKAKAAGRSLRLAMNSFGDATAEELSPRRGLLKSARQTRRANKAAHLHAPPADVATLPTAVDWRQQGVVTPVQDQMTCGSCWAFSSAQALEGQRAIKYGVLEVLPPQAFVDCSWSYDPANPNNNWGNLGCDGGEQSFAYDWMLAAGGLPNKETYGPYLGQDGLCKQGLPVALSISSYTNVTAGSIEALQDAVANVGPIAINIFTELQSFVFYDSGVFDDQGCISGYADLDHAVLAVGYNTTGPEPYWIVKNSWSTYWGDDGYINIAMANNLCGVATDAVYPTVA